MGTTVSGGSFGFNLVSVGGTWSWTVRANNVYGGSQLYQVADVISPWGRLSDVDSPIPGDVVTAMAGSILDVQGQLAPLLSLVQGISSFMVTVTEGDPPMDVTTVPVQNSGAFGSFMTATATPGASWLSSNPSFLKALGKSEQGTFTIRVAPATLLANGSPYSGIVNLQDNRVPSTVIPISILVTVLPRPAFSLSSTNVGLTYSLATMTTGVGNGTVLVTNGGPVNSLLNFSVGKVNNCSAWLQVSPLIAGPLASGGSSLLTFTLVPGLVPGIPGSYTETIQVSSTNASNSPQSITVTLTVTA